MSKIRSIAEALIGLRKLFFTIGTIVFIGTSLLIVLSVFIANWYLGTSVITGDNLESIIIAGFQYTAMIAGSYLAINVVNKWVNKFVSKNK